MAVESPLGVPIHDDEHPAQGVLQRGEQEGERQQEAACLPLAPRGFDLGGVIWEKGGAGAAGTTTLD